jgi:gluconate kinase
VGRKNFLVEGVSGTGKSAVCRELRRRGYAAVDGDNELAYQGDPETGERREGFDHEHHIWDVDRVEVLVASDDDAMTFFCGGSRNFAKFIDLFDLVFVLHVDEATLSRRLDERVTGDWGSTSAERELIFRLHETQEDVPQSATTIDATASLTRVVDQIIDMATAVQ